MALPKPLADTSAKIEAQRSRLIEALSTLSAEDTMRSPGPDRWNAAQVVDHLLLAESFTNDITRMMVDKAKADGEATGFPTDLQTFEPLPPPISLDAPPPIRPRQELPPEELIAALRAMSERSTASIESLTDVDPRKYRMMHPLFGELDLGQWWDVHPVHYEMHIEQAQDALKGETA
jgi:hypothetical protein